MKQDHSSLFHLLNSSSSQRLIENGPAGFMCRVPVSFGEYVRFSGMTGL